MSTETAEATDVTSEFNPAALLDFVIARQGLKNDAALARVLNVAPPAISNVRTGRLPVGATLLADLAEMTDMPVADLRLVMGDRRTKFRNEPRSTK